jgi:prophage tail gpP-like protein
MGNGALWPINALVRVRSPKKLHVDGDMLISQVTFEAGDGGRVTTLTLRRPDAFKPEPQVSSDVLWKELSHI